MSDTGLFSVSTEVCLTRYRFQFRRRYVWQGTVFSSDGGPGIDAGFFGPRAWTGKPYLQQINPLQKGDDAIVVAFFYFHPLGRPDQPGGSDAIV
ncbi:MAG: hypothetical protein EA363_00095 [Balneolaceae bacterium]|nr:MAG: hypothetical protein EA363_00095 [Balneolaceae bacterium]